MEEGAGFTNAVMEGGGGWKGRGLILSFNTGSRVGRGCKIADMSCMRQTEAREENTVI